MEGTDEEFARARSVFVATFEEMNFKVNKANEKKSPNRQQKVGGMTVSPTSLKMTREAVQDISSLILRVRKTTKVADLEALMDTVQSFCLAKPNMSQPLGRLLQLVPKLPTGQEFWAPPDKIRPEHRRRMARSLTALQTAIHDPTGFFQADTTTCPKHCAFAHGATRVTFLFEIEVTENSVVVRRREGPEMCRYTIKASHKNEKLWRTSPQTLALKHIARSVPDHSNVIIASADTDFLSKIARQGYMLRESNLVIARVLEQLRARCVIVAGSLPHIIIIS